MLIQSDTGAMRCPTRSPFCLLFSSGTKLGLWQDEFISEPEYEIRGGKMQTLRVLDLPVQPMTTYLHQWM